MATNTSTLPPNLPVTSFSVVQLAGPMAVAAFISWFLLGTLVIQVFLYHDGEARTKDRWYIQLLVYTCLVLEIFHTIIGTHQAWYYSITAWGKPELLPGRAPWSVPAVPIVGGVIACLVQMFYAWRIWVLSGNWLFRLAAIFAGILAIAQCGAAAGASVLLVINGNNTAALPRMTTAVDVWLSGSFVVDMIIAVCMIWLLSIAKGRSTWQESHSLINKLIVRTVQTGLLTAVVAAVDLIFWTRYSQAEYYQVAAMMLGKLYSNSFVSALNARTFHRMTSPDKNSTVPSAAMRINMSQNNHQRRFGHSLRDQFSTFEGRQSKENSHDKGQDDLTEGQNRHYELSTLSQSHTNKTANSPLAYV